MKIMSILTVLGLLAAGLPALGEASGPSVKEHSDGAKEHAASEKKEAQDEGKEASEEEEGSAKIGPGQGIESYDEHEGLKLSKQALKNFGIQSVALTGPGPWRLPDLARVYSGEEVNLYRLRNGYFFRIDFKELGRGAGFLTVSSGALKAGDRIVTSGQGYLRITEIAASGGASEGDSH